MRAQELRRDAIRVRSALVTVPVIVNDRDGRYVAGLRVEDFQLFQDGLRQPVTLFASSDEPLRVALILDTSLSTVPIQEGIKMAALDFLAGLEPADQITVVRFDAAVDVVCTLGTPREQAEQAIASVGAASEGGTRMRDAVAQVLAAFRQLEGRKAVVLLTDAFDVGSVTRTRELLATAAESGTPIYTVLYGQGLDLAVATGRRKRRRPPGPPLPSPMIEAAHDYLHELSNLSAGRLFPAEVPDLRAAFARVLRELRQQYVLGFYPGRAQQDGKIHVLSVQVSRAGATVRARRAYKADAPESR